MKTDYYKKEFIKLSLFLYRIAVRNLLFIQMKTVAAAFFKNGCLKSPDFIHKTFIGQHDPSYLLYLNYHSTFLHITLHLMEMLNHTLTPKGDEIPIACYKMAVCSYITASILNLLSWVLWSWWLFEIVLFRGGLLFSPNRLNPKIHRFSKQVW